MRYVPLDEDGREIPGKDGRTFESELFHMLELPEGLETPYRRSRGSLSKNCR